MSEILTESFCERCGTRYTFESARPKVRLKGVKVLSLGFKNFVLSDDTSLDEAMAAARSEADREITAHQLDAFHKTFNFCLSCRQYTCPNCWNEVEARCLSCAPHLRDELMPAALPGLAALAKTTVVAEAPTNGANGHSPDETEVEAVAAAESEGLAIEPVAEAAEAAITEPAKKAASQTAGLLRRFRPGQNLEDELAAYEREHLETVLPAGEPELAAAPAEPANDVLIETVQAVEPAAGAVMVEPEPIEAAAEAAEPEVAAVDATSTAEEPAVVAEPRPEPQPDQVLAAEPQPEPEAVAPTADVVEQPTWRITALDTESPADRPATQTDTTIPPKTKASPPPAGEPEWPARPEWPAARASGGLPFLGRPSQPQGGVEALWAASNQELAATPPTLGRSTGGIQPCVSCGLSLSATARFCRRCGTLQAG